jgi:hypothetical protein
MERIDEILKTHDCTWREEQLAILKPAIDHLSIATICGEDEIKWPAGKKRFNYFNIMKDILCEPGRLQQTEKTDSRDV